MLKPPTRSRADRLATARRRYVAALRRTGLSRDAQIRDLARVFAALMAPHASTVPPLAARR